MRRNRNCLSKSGHMAAIFVACWITWMLHVYWPAGDPGADWLTLHRSAACGVLMLYWPAGDPGADWLTLHRSAACGVLMLYWPAGDPGADWLTLHRSAACGVLMIWGWVIMPELACITVSPSMPSGMGLPSRDKLSGVYVPDMWLGDAGADLQWSNCKCNMPLWNNKPLHLTCSTEWN